jgi:hypothetical protein
MPQQLRAASTPAGFERCISGSLRTMVCQQKIQLTARKKHNCLPNTGLSTLPPDISSSHSRSLIHSFV